MSSNPKKVAKTKAKKGTAAVKAKKKTKRERERETEEKKARKEAKAAEKALEEIEAPGIKKRLLECIGRQARGRDGGWIVTYIYEELGDVIWRGELYWTSGLPVRKMQDLVQLLKKKDSVFKTRIREVEAEKDEFVGEEELLRRKEAQAERNSEQCAKAVNIYLCLSFALSLCRSVSLCVCLSVSPSHTHAHTLKYHAVDFVIVTNPHMTNTNDIEHVILYV
jgi:hypothetical protein